MQILLFLPRFLFSFSFRIWNRIRYPSGLKDAYEVDDETDRISSLPDSILCHVLSHLPTKYAFATSILSTRWTNLFPSILNELDIDFDDSLSRAIDDEVEQVNYSFFIDFCNRVFDFHLGDVKHINSFRLLLNQSETSFTHISKWISSALHLNVKKLELVLGNYYHVQYEIPDFIFTCKTLEVLVLVGVLRLKSPPLVELPRLRVLHLVIQPRIYTHNIPFNILNGCPGLEELVINSLIIRDIKAKIWLPNLRRLEMKDCGDNFRNTVISRVILDAPALECLHLDTFLIWILAKHRIGLRIFDNLIRLNLSDINLTFLVGSLPEMPKLEVLVLSKGFNIDIRSAFWRNTTSCLNLKEIRILHRSRSATQIQALKNILNHRAEVKKIVIGTPAASPAEQLCIKTELLALKGVSETCEIVIVTENIFESKFCKL